MIGVVMISHGKMAEGVLDSAKLIFGDVSNVGTVSLVEGQNIDEFKKSVTQKISEADTGKGVLVLVDLFGASPYNGSMYARKELTPVGKQIRIVTGVNLPMILEILAMRGILSLEELAKTAIQNGREGIQEPVIVADNSDDDY